MSVRKREWTSPKGEAKSAWVVDYTDASGKRRLKTFKLKKAADAFAASTTVEISQGVHVAEGASATVEAASRKWIKAITADGLERSSIEDYERTLRLHILPFIGGLRLTALTVTRLRAFEDELREAGRSAATTKRTIVSLGSMLADAQERGLVARNVVRDVRARRGHGERKAEKRQKGRLRIGTDIPTRDEVKALLGAATGRWRPLLLMATFCGLRASELRGLRWTDVDLEKREVHVRQRADRFNDIGRPKSVSGERTVPAPPPVVNALREWKLACPKGDLGLVFPNGSGRVEQLNNILRRGLHPTWIAAGVSTDTGEKDAEGNPILAPRYTGMHALRHWFASWCINRKEEGGLGLPPKTVQDRMGHSTIALTMDRYSHLFPSDDDGSELAAASAWLAN